ncbi:flagellar hook-basal body complex protein FliE [Gorillibacterium sp. sgz5001074]|uniref:flagellar hook-basal body complex protein FliE n=1 Tax=Gorillibacterium sp. sgz5001074 TaxID=3446695 RepID=UPI003F6818CE
MLEKMSFQPSVSALKILQPADKGKETGAAQVGQSFGDLLNQTLNQLSTQEKVVGELNGAFIRGESVDTHQLMIQSEKMSLGLQLTVQVRNKAIEAYQEIMRMQM